MNYEVIAPRSGTLDDLIEAGSLPAYAPPVLDFIDTLSRRILAASHFRGHPELVAMAFWMRRGHLRRLQERFETQKGDALWLARGTAFHLAPSNVDSIFIYSWFLSMLVGNANIVRLSTKHSLQMDLLLELVTELLDQQEFRAVRERTLLVRYGHDDQTTGFFSAHCHTRVIWGGDQTVQTIRAIPINPTATEIVFADKFSLAAIEADAYLVQDDKSAIIDAFFKDSYWFGQMACSSPRLVVWVGPADSVARAREDFWLSLEGKVRREATGEISAADMMNKLVASCEYAVKSSVTIPKSASNLLNRIELDSLVDLDTDSHCGAGLFLEYVAGGLDEILPMLSRKIQTLSAHGFDRQQITDLLQSSQSRGIDRVVPFGQSLDFSFVWDGYDLQRQFVREIEVTIP